MDIVLFKKLLEQQLITEEEFRNIEQQDKSISVHSDLSTLLYVGILLLAGGLGILVYKNISSIGHAAILTAIAIVCLMCFFYCFKKGKGYSNEKVATVNIFFDYVLLLGCLLLLTFIGYSQFEYNVFGKNLGLATFIPMLLLFASAYYFDHLGVLSMAITNLAAWAGFTVAPTDILYKNDFNDETLIYTAIILGIGLIAISVVSASNRIKAHFAYTYKNFGLNILFISLLAALFHFTAFYLLWFLVLTIVVVLSFVTALKDMSFYFLVITVLYGYVGLSYVTVDFLFRYDQGIGTFYIAFLYFIASGIGLIRLFISYNKILRKNADL